jgi:hypothetical protein
MSAGPAQIPVADGLFDLAEDGAALVGSVCAGCGTHYFPTAVSCRNPACDDKQVGPATLGRTGTLYSWTVQGYRPPALFRMDDWAPYAIGLVEVPEGLRVLAMLTEHERLEIGMPLELVVEPLYVDDEGRQVLTYKYAPRGSR